MRASTASLAALASSSLLLAPIVAAGPVAQVLAPRSGSDYVSSAQLNQSQQIVYKDHEAMGTPTPARRDTNAAPTPISSAMQAQYSTIARFAAAAECPSVANGWTCGSACDVDPKTQVIWHGGDDNATPYAYVAYSPAQSAIVVAHQGTNTSSLLSILDDATFVPWGLDSDLSTYGNAPTPTGTPMVHSGFQNTFSNTAASVLSAVQTGLSKYQVSKVIVTGHSLGAAISLLEAVHMKEKLATSVSIVANVFGLPRVGNQDFANWVDAMYPPAFASTTAFYHLVDANDIVPHLPPEDLGFRHPSGEVFINPAGSNSASWCPGQEDDQCSNQYSALSLSTSPHDGPYFGQPMGGSYACS